MTLETDNVKPFPAIIDEEIGLDPTTDNVVGFGRTTQERITNKLKSMTGGRGGGGGPDLPMYQRVGALEGQVALLTRKLEDLFVLLTEPSPTETRKPGPPKLRRHPK